MKLRAFSTVFLFCVFSTIIRTGFYSTLALSLVAGVAVYPAAWGETAVQETCGPTADQYNIGRCHVRWAYLLAIIGSLDAVVLSALAFILATRHVRLQPDSGYPPPSLYKGSYIAGSPPGYLLAIIGSLDAVVLSALAFILATRHVRLQPDSGYPPPSLYKGEVNNAYVTDAASVAGSRKSLALQPVLIMHPHAPVDMGDTYSHYSGRTGRSKHGLYANTMHNYQL